MIQRFAFLCLISALLLTGCATKNDAGVVLHKKPDLTKVTPGTPISKVAGLKKPIKREVITKGELKGAQAWLYEWDAPNDEVNNKMFTSVVVKDGIITGFYEETPDKWRKDPKLHKSAQLASAFEDIASLNQRAAEAQMASAILANYNATTVMYNQANSAQNDLNNALFAHTLQQQSASQVPRTRFRPDGFGNYLGSNRSRLRPDGFGNYLGNDGTRFRPDGFGNYLGSDRNRLRPDGFGGLTE